MSFISRILREQELSIIRTPEQVAWPLWLENMLYGTEDSPSKYFAKIKEVGVKLDKRKKEMPKKIKARLVQIKRNLDDNKKKGSLDNKTYKTLWGQFYKQVAIDYAERWMRTNEHRIEAMKKRKDAPKVEIPYWLDKMMGGKEGQPSQEFLDLDLDIPGDLIIDYSQGDMPKKVKARIVVGVAKAVKGHQGVARQKVKKEATNKIRLAIWRYYINQIFKGQQPEVPSVEAPPAELGAARVLPKGEDKIAGREANGLPVAGTALGFRHPVWKKYLMVGRPRNAGDPLGASPEGAKTDWMAISPFKMENREDTLVVVRDDTILIKNNPKEGQFYFWTHPSVPSHQPKNMWDGTGIPSEGQRHPKAPHILVWGESTTSTDDEPRWWWWSTSEYEHDEDEETGIEKYFKKDDPEKDIVLYVKQGGANEPNIKVSRVFPFPEDAAEAEEEAPAERPGGGPTVEAYLRSLSTKDKKWLGKWPRAKKSGKRWVGGTWTKLISILSLPNKKPSRADRKKLKAAIKKVLGMRGNRGVPRGRNYIEDLVKNPEIQRLMPFFGGVAAGAASPADQRIDLEAKPEMFVSTEAREGHQKMHIDANNDYFHYPPRGSRDPLTAPGTSTYVEGYQGFDGSGKFSDTVKELFGFNDFTARIDPELKTENPKEYKKLVKQNADKQYSSAWAQYVNQNRSDVRRKRRSSEDHWSGVEAPSFHPIHVGMAFKEFFHNARTTDYVAMVLVPGGAEASEILKPGTVNERAEEIIKARKGFFGVDNSKSKIGQTGTLYIAMTDPVGGLDDPSKLIDIVADKANKKITPLTNNYSFLPVVNSSWETIGVLYEEPPAEAEGAEVEEEFEPGIRDLVSVDKAAGEFAVLDDLLPPEALDFNKSLKFGMTFDRKLSSAESWRILILPKNRKVLTQAEDIMAKRIGSKTDFKLKIGPSGAGSL